MSSSRTGMALGILLAMAFVVLTGCQAGMSPQGGPSQSPQASTPNQTTGPISTIPGKDVVQASPRTDVPDDFPLVRYWDAVRQGIDFVQSLTDSDAVVEWWDSREADIAKCLKEEGFLYFPRRRAVTENHPETAPFPQDYLAIPRLANTRNEVQELGYGIEPPEVELLEEPNLNQEYVDSLSPPERSAYYLVLVGVDITDPDYDPYTHTELGGCLGSAERAYPDPAEMNSALDVLVHHGDIITEMTIFTRHGTMFRDPAVLRLNREWRNCMSRHGFELDLPSREGSYWDGPLQAYMRAIRTGISGETSDTTAETAALPDDQTRLIGSAVEREIALLDFDCREEVNYMAAFTEAQRVKEQAFVDLNRKLLEEMRSFVDALS